MTKIKYVGLKKDGETALSHLTGISLWMPGDVHDIDKPAAVAKMLRHPDVFALAGAAPVAEAKPAPAIAPTLAPKTVTNPAAVSLAPGVPVGATPPAGVNVIKVEEGDLVLDAMEAPELHALAKQLGVKVHHAAGAQKVIDALVASQK